MKISKEEFLSLSGMEDETLSAWIEEEWLIPSRSPEPNFSEIDIARVRFIHELRVDFGVNDEGVGVVLKLVDQLHGMRRTLRELRQEVRTTPEQG